MSTKDSAFFFKLHSQQRLQETTFVFDGLFTQMLIPHPSGRLHAAGLMYPFAHIGHLVLDSLHIARGIVLLATYLVALDSYACGAIVEGGAVRLSSILLDVFNCVLSTLAIFTRTLRCALTLGYCYTYNPLQPPKNPVSDTTFFGNPVEISLTQPLDYYDGMLVYSNTWRALTPPETTPTRNYY